MRCSGTRLFRLALIAFSITTLSSLPFSSLSAQDKAADTATPPQTPEEKAAAQKAADEAAAVKKAAEEKAADAKAAAVIAKMAQRKLDAVASIQQQSVEKNKPLLAHWGPDPNKYSTWKSHSNRLIPLYVFGDSLERVRGVNSLYRDAAKIEKLYGFMPTNTVNPAAEYFDQTDVYRLQKSAVESGKKRIILFVFDGTDWQTTWAASIAKSKKVLYTRAVALGCICKTIEAWPPILVTS